MLRRSRRLDTRQFKEVMERGRTTHSPLFTVRSAKAAGTPRIAAVAPEKAAGSAVLRNSLRRRMYAAIRPLYPSLKSDTQTVIFAKPAAAKAGFKEMAAEIRSFLSKPAF